MRHGANLFFLFILVAGNPIPKCAAYIIPPEQAQMVDYDTFGKLDIQERRKVFNEISPENKAEIMRTHVRRWLETNRNRLSSEQISVLEESIKSITADSYRLPRSNEVMKRAKELEAKTAAVFSQEDMVQAFTLDGDYIPSKKK
ncbi:MAG: bacteriocin fulvocin C-related protein [Acidobacteriia bacterium]|nr:bacteriocin fulvocin C-related protein [Terriglobia bacterium]